MRSKSFGPDKWNVPIIGQGTWQLSQSSDALEEAKASLKAGIELGLTHIDTAEMYGSGSAEELVGEIIKGIPRERLFIVSKVLPSNASFKGTIEACERSLARLKTDYLDCYLLHWRGSHPIAQTMKAMEELVAQGKIRSHGVSNFDIEDIEEAIQHLTTTQIACNQVLYHLKERGIERALIPYCQERGINVVAYTPFGRGVPDDDTESGATLKAIARKHDATVRQVTLAFVVRLEGMLTIPKASRLEHVRENAGACDLSLDTEDIARIDEQFPAPKRRTPLAWA
jgi:diketogulonate reductase-like aldo/keto reductase